MFKNYIVTAVRSLKKSRFFTLINIVGLTTGISASLIILLYVRFELSYDKFNTKADRVVRVDWEMSFGSVHNYNAAVTPPMAEVMARDFPEVEAAARLRYAGVFQVKRNIENIDEWQGVFADNDLFKILTIPFIAGNSQTALRDPNSMVITEKCAAEFFPNEDALDKTLILNNVWNYKITGIVKDLPDNSHFHYRMFLSMEGLDEAKNGNWIGGPFNTYLLLRNGTDPQTLEAKLPGMVEKYLVPQASTILGSSFMEDFKNGRNSLKLHLRPLLDIHLHSHLRNELEENGDVEYVYLMSAVGIFILLIACINFMNLATARSANRGREVGVRKVLGSNRASLAIQFLGESTILSVVSFLLALIIAYSVLPIFNSIVGINLTVPWGDRVLVIWMTGSAILIGIVAGLYPAFVLSSFKPALVLKGQFTSGPDSSLFRSGLVVFQFGVSIMLIICTFALYQQMDFIRNRNLGFNKEQVILLRDVQNAGKNLYSFRENLSTESFIKGSTISSFFPGPGSHRSTPLMWRYGTTPSPETSVTAEKWLVDYDYIPTLGMQMVVGRNFSRAFPSDSSAVILNETALGMLGFPANPLGKKISLFHSNPDGSQDKSKLETWTIIGVVKDFNFESLRDKIAPLGLFFGESTGDIAFRYEPTETKRVIETLESKWKAICPGEPFHYSFLDQDYMRMYAAEEKLGMIFILFSGLAVVIACLGLFALTAFTTEQRTKEIGVRRVLGATTQNIVLLLTKEFGKLVLLAFVLAAPVAAYCIDSYLEQYAFRAHIDIWIYFVSGLLACLLALATMAYQSVTAAHADPVESLKGE